MSVYFSLTKHRLIDLTGNLPMVQYIKYKEPEVVKNDSSNDGVLCNSKCNMDNNVTHTYRYCPHCGTRLY